MSTSMSVRALYLAQPALLVAPAKVIAKGEMTIKDKQYHWIQLDQTIFHPQGGGQPADKGTINGIPVDFVSKVLWADKIDEFDIHHCFLEPVPFKIHEIVKLEVNGNSRKLNMRMHTTGHLIAELIEQQFPFLQATGGNHFPGQGYMTFKNKKSDFDDVKQLEAFLTQSIEDRKSRHVPVNIVIEEGTRKLQVESSKVPCGGTHLSDLSEVGPLKIGPFKVNKKEETITIKYNVLEEKKGDVS